MHVDEVQKPSVMNMQTETCDADININNSQSILENISRLYADRLMSDICLIVGGTEYPSHRLILCATSDVFQVMLMHPQWIESGVHRVVLQETPECCAVFSSFLKYFYTGQITFTETKIIPLLSLADKYNVKSLEEICIKYMKTHIAHAALQNQLVTWFQYTAVTGHHEVAVLCNNFIKWNFELVAKTSDFDNFEPDMLLSILKNSDLVVNDEITLYNIIAKWLSNQSIRISEEMPQEDLAEQAFQKLVYNVMSYVRFPMMTPRQLADLLLNPLTTKYKEFFVDRFAIGMSFHSDQQDRVQHTINFLEEGKLLFQPRLYTSDSWSTLLTIENFNTLPCYHTSTFVFSSHSTLAEHGRDRLCEWVVDLFPKGVWFKKCLLIVWQGTVEVPESVLRTVRLAITCKDPPAPISKPGQWDVCPYMRVKVGILINGCQGGIEHVMTVKEKVHHFSAIDRVMNIDDLIPFDELNPPATKDLVGNNTVNPSVSDSHLVGSFRNELKIHIVISPISDSCYRMENSIE